MTSRQVQLIEDSWDYITANIHEAGRLFYDRLFEQNPGLKFLFKGNLREQEQKLISLITFAVKKLRNIETIISDVEALGKRHKGYGVLDEHYQDVASALLWTLETGLGDRWNEETKQAWTDLYITLAGIMKKASAAV